MKYMLGRKFIETKINFKMISTSRYFLLNKTGRRDLDWLPATTLNEHVVWTTLTYYTLHSVENHPNYS